jgi:general secretion pathway protein G
VARTLTHLIIAVLTINVPLWGYEAELRIDAAQATASKESELRDTLRLVRSLIAQYSVTRGHAPESLTALISAGYLRDIPVDPMTNSAATWVVIIDEYRVARDGRVGILDIKSGSDAVDSTGRLRYCDW